MTGRKRVLERWVDRNRVPTERVVIDGQEVVVHYDDIPESDVCVVDGMRCTTPLRMVIDLAPELSPPELEQIVAQCLELGRFTRDQALARACEPDVASRLGAQLLRRCLGDTR